MTTAKPLPSPCVFDITVDAEFVHIAWTAGRTFIRGSNEPRIGRQQPQPAGVMFAQTDVDEDGEFTRTSLDGFVTDSASDALLWASELAGGGREGFRRAIEVDHAVIVAALAPAEARS